MMVDELLSRHRADGVCWGAWLKSKTVSYTHLDEATVEIIDSEDVPLAYYPGKTSRIRIKAAGDLRMAQTEK